MCPRSWAVTPTKHIAMLDQWIPRSKACPLSFRLDYPDCLGASEEVTKQWIQEVEEVIEKLVKQSQR